MVRSVLFCKTFFRDTCLETMGKYASIDDTVWIQFKSTDAGNFKETWTMESFEIKHVPTPVPTRFP